jgi:thiol-disulfide isomerase/thioredoxin
MEKFLFLLFLLVGCKGGEEVDTSKQVTEEEESPITWDECSYRIGEHICNLELVDSTAEVFDLYSHYGQPIIIDLSAMWCAPCNQAAPWADIFVQGYAEHDLLWVTILIEDEGGNVPDAEDLLRWVDNHNITDSLVLKGSRDLIDISGTDGFPLTSWPTFVFIDQEMVIYHGVAGWSSEYMNQKLTEMLVIDPE